MTSLSLVSVAVCLFACVHGWGEQLQPQYHPQYPYGPYPSGYPSGQVYPYGRVGGDGGAPGARRPGHGGDGGAPGAGRPGHGGAPGAGRPGHGGDGGAPGAGRPGHGGAPGAGRPGHGGAGRPGRGGAGGAPGARRPGHGGAAGVPGARRPGHGGPGKKLPQPEKYVNPQDAVASSVIRTTDQYFYKAGPVGFDKVLTNINGGYNPEYGVFTAPVPGIYDIKYQVQTKEGSPKLAHVDLTKNGKVVNSAKAKGECATASNSAVLYLDQFDRLSVNGREGTVIGCEDNNFCSFSVSLIKPGKFTDQKIARAVPMDKW